MSDDEAKLDWDFESITMSGVTAATRVPLVFKSQSSSTAASVCDGYETKPLHRNGAPVMAGDLIEGRSYIVNPGTGEMSEDDIKPWNKVRHPTDEQIGRLLVEARFAEIIPQERSIESDRMAKLIIFALLNKDKILGYGHD